MKLLLAPLAVLACLSGGWLVYHDSLDHVAGQQVAEVVKKPLAVQVTWLGRQSVEERVDLVGSLEPMTRVEIRTRIDGYLTRIPFDVGEFVKSGEVVAELDNSRYRELVSRAESALKVAQAQLQAQRTRATLADTEVQRLLKLAKSGVSTRQQLDRARAQQQIATAEVDLEKARVNQAESDVARSNLALNETRITAPLSGWIGKRMVEVGDLAKPELGLLTIVDLTKVSTVVHMVEKDYPKVKLHQPATVQVDAYPDKLFFGEVVRKAPVLDPGTRTAAVHIEFSNPDNLLKPGMHARVGIRFARHSKASVLPITSLVDHDGRAAVYVVSGDPPRASLQDVTVGINNGKVVEILSGIRPEDRVVTLGSRMVHPDQTVLPMATSHSTSL